MRAIFISYRRDDSEGEAGRLFDDLVSHFGEDSVFMDVSAIAPGRDFRKAIDESVATCGVLLAIIGQNWIPAKNEAGQRRLDDPTDFVRLETASALKRDIPVVPVLIRGAKMPRPEQLPDDVKDLAYRNGVELTHARWASDVQLLIRALRAHVPDLRAVAGAPAGTAETSPRSTPKVPPRVDPPRSGDHGPGGGGPVDRQSEHGSGPGPGPSGARRSRTKWVAAVGGALVILAAAGYGVYSSFTTDGGKQRTDQQRRAAEEEAAKRREAERADLAQKKADIDNAAAKLAADRAAVEKTAADKAAADKVAADKAEVDRRREAAETARRAAAEKAAAEKAAAERAAAEKAIADRAVEADRRREAAEAERRAAAERAEAERRRQEEVSRMPTERPAGDRPTPPSPSGPRPPTGPVPPEVKITKAECTDLGSSRYRINLWGTAYGSGAAVLTTGPTIPPNSGNRTSEGKLSCLGWRGTVTSPAGGVSDRHCKRNENEATRTLWSSWHIVEWRQGEPGAAAANLFGDEKLRASDFTQFKCTR